MKQLSRLQLTTLPPSQTVCSVRLKPPRRPRIGEKKPLKPGPELRRDSGRNPTASWLVEKLEMWAKPSRIKDMVVITIIAAKDVRMGGAMSSRTCISQGERRAAGRPVL